MIKSKKDILREILQEFPFEVTPGPEPSYKQWKFWIDELDRTIGLTNFDILGDSFFFNKSENALWFKLTYF